MSNTHDKLNHASIVSLVKDTVDSLGDLIGNHIKLARAELGAEAKEVGRRTALLAAASSFLFLGYGLACVGVALTIGRRTGEPQAFFVVAAAHVVTGATVLALVMRRLSSVRPMSETTLELSRTATALSSTRVR